jgi:hypothetical protein
VVRIEHQTILQQLSPVLTIIPKPFMDAVLALSSKLDGKNINWVVNGDLAEELRTVNISPEKIEVICQNHSLEQAFLTLQEFNPSPITYSTRQLQRDAVIGGAVYPIYVRSYSFDLILVGVPIRVQSDVQFKVGDWDWGDAYEFTPEYVNVTGKKVAVTPLSVAYELYHNLGWIDRMQKIEAVIQRGHTRRQF